MYFRINLIAFKCFLPYKVIMINTCIICTDEKEFEDNGAGSGGNFVPQALLQGVTQLRNTRSQGIPIIELQKIIVDQIFQGIPSLEEQYISGSDIPGVWVYLGVKNNTYISVDQIYILYI